MTLSVVIPIYNKSGFLLELLECCRRQTLKDWELILVDDGSSDEHYDVVEEYSKIDPRIILLKRDRLPKNGNTCRNIGIEKSKGVYTMILDSDDLISDDCFARRVQFMERNPDVDYASFPGRPFLNSLSSPENKRLKNLYGIKSNNHSIPYNLINLSYPFTVWTNIYKTESIKKIRWDEKVFVMQDLDWMLSCHLAGLKHRYANLQEYDYFYRQFSTGNNVCADFSSPQKCNSTIYLCGKILNEVQNYKDEDLSKVYHKFVVRQFQRIIQKRNEEMTRHFLKSCCFVDKRTLKQMEKVATHFLCKKSKWDALHLYFLLSYYISLGYYWRELLWSLKSIVKGITPPFYT